METKESTTDVVSKLQKWFYDGLKEWQKDLKPGQKLALFGEISAEECTATVNLLENLKGRPKPLHRPLSAEELNKIGAIKDFNKKMRELVDLFLSSGNQPRTRREMDRLGKQSHIDQINGVIRKKGLRYGLYYWKDPASREKGVGVWTDQICFRATE
jgi:hypothetical protein